MTVPGSRDKTSPSKIKIFSRRKYFNHRCKWWAYKPTLNISGSVDTAVILLEFMGLLCLIR
uniref:Uncharacterized protein n=1 Tax=Ciona intestinalis TaxID=7719 RepID=H2XZF8_CIOIN